MQYFLTEQPQYANLSVHLAASAYQPFATGEFGVSDENHGAQ
jgi:hypothetical protein